MPGITHSNTPFTNVRPRPAQVNGGPLVPIPVNGVNGAPARATPALPPATIVCGTSLPNGTPLILDIPPVISSRRAMFNSQYGAGENILQVYDERSRLDGNSFLYPLTDYSDSASLQSIPVSVFHDIVVDNRRSPILSFRQDTRTTISRISPDLVVKWGPDVHQVEADMMKYITGLPNAASLRVPRVHRVFRHQCFYFIVMEYIDGLNLVEAWPTLGEERQEEVGFQVSDAIRSMQTHLSTNPGPISGKHCRGIVDSQNPLPVGTSRAGYERHINGLINKVNASLMAQFTLLLDPVRFNQFMLVNQRLDPSSIVIDKNHRVWIVGWKDAGFYPPECELAMVEQLTPPRYEMLTKRIAEVIPHDPQMMRTMNTIAYVLWRQRLLTRLSTALHDAPWHGPLLWGPPPGLGI